MRCAVYRQFSAGGDLLYVGCSDDPRRRNDRHASNAAWAAEIAWVEVEWFSSRMEALAKERAAIAAENPKYNVAHKGQSPIAQLFTDYLAEANTTQAQIAQILGVRQATVSDWIHGRSLPRVDTAVRLENLTNGMVPVTAWVPEFFEAAQ